MLIKICKNCFNIGNLSCSVVNRHSIVFYESWFEMKVFDMLWIICECYNDGTAELYSLV